MLLFQEIKEAIASLFEKAEVIVEDPNQDNTHLYAYVISNEFEGLPLIKRHRKVMQGLKEHFSTSLHALALKTYTVSEWQSIQGEQ